MPEPDPVYNYIMLGLNDIDEEGTYVWESTSLQMSFSNWDSPVDPGNTLGENCSGMKISDGLWVDLPCNWVLFPFCHLEI